MLKWNGYFLRNEDTGMHVPEDRYVIKRKKKLRESTRFKES